MIIPRRNEPDIEDIPAHLRKRMKFTLVDDVDEVLNAALEKRREATTGESPGTRRESRVECPDRRRIEESNGR